MRRLIFLIVLCCWVSNIFSQKEDYQWMVGYTGGVALGSPDTGINKQFGCTRMDFTKTPVDTIRTRFDLSTTHTNTSISDSFGNLLFYTNGVQIYNSQHKLMDNGDSLNPSAFQYWWDPSIQTDGYRIPQGVIAIRQPNSNNKYYVFHVLVDTSNDINIQLFNSKLLYSVVDMSANGGLGKVVTKNIALINDTIGNNISVCKHSNGIDWWLLVQERNTNCFYKVLLDSLGTHVQSTRVCLGSIVPVQQGTQSCFSPDGKWYSSFSTNGGIDIFKFNRCNGSLSHVVNYPVPEVIDSGWNGIGIAISPSSRYLYALVTFRLYQFDLWAANIPTSKVTVGLYDGFNEVNSIYSTAFGEIQSGPNGKIYIISGNGSHYMNVIDSPDNGGIACHLNQHSFRIPCWNTGLPNFPNYRLGPLITPHGVTIKDSTLCAGDSISLGLPAIADMSYLWHRAGSTWTSHSSNPVFHADITATFYLTVTDTFSGQPCGESYDTVHVTVTPLPPQGTMVRDTAICKGDSLSIGKSKIANLLYHWTDSAGWNSTMSNPKLKIDTTSQFYLIETDTSINQLCRLRYDTITVHAKPILAIQRGTIADTTVCKGDTLAIGVPIQAHLSYQWHQKYSSWVSHSSSPSRRVDSSTIYYLNMTDTSTQSCGVRKDTVNVSIKQVGCTNGISDPPLSTDLTLTLYPNPASTTLYIANIDGVAHILLTDAIGCTLRDLPIEPQQPLLHTDIHSLATGIYFLRAIYSDGSVVTRRWQIVR